MAAMESESAVGPKSLRQLLDAVLAIGADLDIHTVLQHIIEAATSLADARYGALGILDATGTSLSDFLTVGVDEETRVRIGSYPKGHGILGLLIADPRPLRLPDLNEHPDSFGFPPGHPPMRSFLGVPVIVHGKVFGNLYLCDKTTGDVFTEVDEELLVGFATAAGVAIDNARLHSTLSDMALLQDRERIAMDLHDNVIQQLFAIGLSLQASLQRVQDPELSVRIETAVQDLDATIRQIRTTIFDLDAANRGGGVRDRLLALVAEVSDSLPSHPRVSFEGPIDAAVGESTGSELVTVLREALSNVARHAEAKHVEVSLVVDDQALTLIVDDDGVGPPPLGSPTTGRGLRNMTHRAERLHGRFTIAGRPGGGTRQRWSVPRRT
jgi:signal transduction histidine kinase